MTPTTALTIEETGDTVIIKRDGVEIALGPNHSVVVHSDGVEIDLGPDHSVVVHSDGDVKLQHVPANDTTITAAKAAPANDTATTRAGAALEVGDRMQDGSIFAGLSPDTGNQMFAMPADAGILMTFNEAAKYAKDLNVAKTLSHDDWRLPTKAELDVLFQNREKGALKGTFRLTQFPHNSYWSGTLFNDAFAYHQCFDDSSRGVSNVGCVSSVRCVRG
jgi:hypothetical protein